MTMKEIFHKAIISGADPLSIPDLGFAYLNDIGIWNININSQNTRCINKTITAGQLLDIFQNHSVCYKNQIDCFEEKKEKMIQILKQHDPDTVINL